MENPTLRRRRRIAQWSPFENTLTALTALLVISLGGYLALTDPPADPERVPPNYFLFLALIGGIFIAGLLTILASWSHRLLGDATLKEVQDRAASSQDPAAQRKNQRLKPDTRTRRPS